MSDNLKTTFHRDGTVTYWDVHLQQWQRIDARHICASTLATLPADERAQIRALGMGITTRWTLWKERPYMEPVTTNDGPAAGGTVRVERRRKGDVIQERLVMFNALGVPNIVGAVYEI